MPVFISYSHKDSVFVDKLCQNLVAQKVHIWIDRWEMTPGDSLVSAVQAALEQAGAIIVVLSPDYINSQWCKKELNAGFIKELENSGNTIIPLLLIDCERPIFLREKVWADFRKEFDKPFSYLMEAIAKHVSINQGRTDTPEYKIDWSIDIGISLDGIIQLRYNILQHAPDRPFSIFSIISANLNQPASKRFTDLSKNGFEWFALSCFTTLIMEALAKNDLRIALNDSRPVVSSFGVKDAKRNIEVMAEIETRWLGEDTGKTILLNLSDHISQLVSPMTSKARKLTDLEKQRLNKMVSDFV